MPNLSQLQGYTLIGIALVIMTVQTNIESLILDGDDIQLAEYYFGDCILAVK